MQVIRYYHFRGDDKAACEHCAATLVNGEELLREGDRWLHLGCQDEIVKARVAAVVALWPARLPGCREISRLGRRVWEPLREAS